MFSLRWDLSIFLRRAISAERVSLWPDGGLGASLIFANLGSFELRGKVSVVELKVFAVCDEHGKR